jgi:hypothetical protein
MMGLKLQQCRILTRRGIDWDSMTREETELIDTVCCICFKPIRTEREFKDDSICSKRCANKGHKRMGVVPYDHND